MEQFTEFFNKLLLIVATIALFFSLYSATPYKWMDSVSIYLAVLLVCVISATCEFGKNKQFLKLQSEILNETCTVLRGQYGTSQQIYVKDIVVGDIVVLQAGDRVPADCFLIEEMDMFVDQKEYFAD